MPDYDFTQTRSQLVERALRLIGALSLGEATSGEAMNQGVQALNAMVKSWQNDHVFLWTVQVLPLQLSQDQYRYPLSTVEPPVISIDAMWIETPAVAPPTGLTDWKPGIAVAKDELVSASGNAYAASKAGAMGSRAPTVNGQGVGQDGTMLWQNIRMVLWGQSRAYLVGDYVQTVTDEKFIATTAGTSAATGNGPTGSGPGIVDGTVVWSSITVPVWSANTPYAVGAYVWDDFSGPHYHAVNSGTSGQHIPKWIRTGSTFMEPDSDVSSLYWIYNYTLPVPKSPGQTNLERLAFRDYQRCVDGKLTPSSFPTHFAIDNQRSLTIHVYPPPDRQYNSNLLAVTKLKDWDDAGGNGDFPVRWLDALTYGLAANLGDEYGIPIGERQSLGQKAQMLYKDAKRGDRDQSDEEFVRGAFG